MVFHQTHSWSWQTHSRAYASSQARGPGSFALYWKDFQRNRCETPAGVGAARFPFSEACLDPSGQGARWTGPVSVPCKGAETHVFQAPASRGRGRNKHKRTQFCFSPVQSQDLSCLGSRDPMAQAAVRWKGGSVR